METDDSLPCSQNPANRTYLLTTYVIKIPVNMSSNLHLAVPSGLFPLGFPDETFYEFLTPSMRAVCSRNLTLLYLIALIPFGVEKFAWID
jgi:hypothetical protein